jgi:hypothetical protein
MKKPTRPTVQYGQTEPFPLLTEIAEEYSAQMSTADQHQQQKQGEGNYQNPHPRPRQPELQPREHPEELNQAAGEQQQKSPKGYPQPGAPPERALGLQHSAPQHVSQEEQHKEEKLQKAEL